MGRQKSTVCNERQEKLVDNLMKGMSETAAIQAAGYNTNSNSAARTEIVQKTLAEARQNIRDTTTLTRLDIIEGILDAIQMARVQSEPATMIAGYDKLAKIIGAYEPTVHKVTVDENGLRVLRKMEAMSREELIMISQGTAKVIDGEFCRIS